MQLKDNERLRGAIRFLKATDKIKSQADLAAVLGYKTSYISDLVNGRFDLSEKFAKKLEAAYFVNSNWLITGNGEMLLKEESTDEEPPDKNLVTKTDEEMSNQNVFAELMKVIDRLQTENEKEGERIDRLISLLEKVTGLDNEKEIVINPKKRNTSLINRP